MGLDGVELILAVENSFKIFIEDAEASAVVTVGQLRDLVISKLEKRDEANCFSMAAFYRLRNPLAAVTGWKRHDIRPSTALASVLPPEKRIAAWVYLEEKTGFTLPKLQHPGYVFTVFKYLLLATAILIFIAAYKYGTSLAWLFAGLLIECGVLYLFLRLTPKLAIAIVTKPADLGSLTKDVIALNHAKVADQARGWTEAEVWTSLRRLIALQLCMEPESIHPDSRFVDDLGLD